jgi:hypothetical protein
MRRSRRVRGRVSLTNGKRLLGKLISLFQKLNNLGMRSQMLRRWECNRVCASIVLERPKIAAKLTSSFPSPGQRNHSVGLLSRPARRGCKRKSVLTGRSQRAIASRPMRCVNFRTDRSSRISRSLGRPMAPLISSIGMAHTPQFSIAVQIGGRGRRCNKAACVIAIR